MSTAWTFSTLGMDGNDLFVVKAQVEVGCRPSVLCLEYDATFPPKMRISIEFA